VKVGDLVKLKCPTTRNFNKVFLVTACRTNWIKVEGGRGWHAIGDFEVISESR